MKLLIVILLLLTSERLFSQDNIGYKVDSLIQVNISSHKIKGISVGVVFDNKIQFVKGYGTLNDKTKTVISPNTPFLTASISKVFVATAIMQLKEKKLFNLNDKIAQLLPEFTMKDTNYKLITIRQLLNHTSGLPEGIPYTWDRKKNKGMDIKYFTLSLSKRKLLFKPEEKFGYSNTGYVLLGYLIEKLSNKPFSAYIQENILQPIEMTRSNFDLNYFDNSEFPTYYNIKGKEQKCCITNTSPSGNLISTAIDLSKWMLHNLAIYNKDISEDSSVISRQSQTILWTPSQTFKGSKTTLGLGWWQYHSEKYGTSVFHSGHFDNFSVSNLVMFPEQNFGFVILCNTESGLDAVYKDITAGLTKIIVQKLNDENNGR